MNKNVLFQRYMTYLPQAYTMTYIGAIKQKVKNMVPALDKLTDDKEKEKQPVGVKRVPKAFFRGGTGLSCLRLIVWIW